eukprot:CAMPEP_0116114928 /NCGR_PEP_ID=MMETSP0329-20121206/234_1 /TAXON_ID=697910 /ORGANISM="Pseudo-nitzschia arenysensis, Strain B593" /LENGTH=405 /DNA_ID=CAMNT_0003608325 /DNA_START=186 /DNA_END=1400 /DNA_ORIENTATION=-
MADKDILSPEFDSPSRRSTIMIAGFNLTATIMGGGVLSIPYALSKTGVVLGSLLMVVAAIATERSMYLLCLCSRMTGAKTFGEVGEAAFGKNMEYFISCVLCVFLCFAMIGYMVLAKDIWTSVIAVIGNMETPPNEDLVLGAIVLLLVPLLVQKSLHALRFSCYVGVLSVSTLCVALVRHAMAVPEWSNVLMWSTNLDDVLVAFPIISLSFLGIFNVLPIQNALVRPSRTRIELVLNGAIVTVFFISFVFGMAGYLYAGINTQGNILKNCDVTDDFNLLLGKLGCGMMVILAIPLMMLPCRSCLLEIIGILLNLAHEEQSETLPLKLSDKTTKERSYDTMSTTDTDNDLEVSLRTEGQTQQLTNIDPRRKVTILDNASIHYGSTFFLFASCYMVAIRVPGVAVVW